MFTQTRGFYQGYQSDGQQFSAGYPTGTQQFGGAASGTHTSSKDPRSINSRVFVGNLNTIGASKEEIEAIFCAYGPISGVSLHKGYGFIQFENEADARIACQEDGRDYNGMQWDVNMAAEPKAGARKQGQKRNAGQMSRGGRGARGGRGGSIFSQNQPLGPASKKPRGGLGSRAGGHGSRGGGGAYRGNRGGTFDRSYSVKTEEIGDLVEDEETKEESSQDILVCGWCKELYRSMDEFSAHRRRTCTVKFTCKCKFLSHIGDLAKEVSLQCATCFEQFNTGWDLCHHVQNDHKIHIYVDESVEQEGLMNEAGDAFDQTAQGIYEEGMNGE